MNKFNGLISKQYRLYRGGGILLRISCLLNKWISWRYHCDIPQTLDLEGVFLCHNGFGIIINPKARIGKGTVIQHSVTIGSRHDINETMAPQIGENCYIGAKATLIGNIRIGNNVKIGAGAVVLKDIPDGATAVGVPAKIITR